MADTRKRAPAKKPVRRAAARAPRARRAAPAKAVEGAADSDESDGAGDDEDDPEARLTKELQGYERKWEKGYFRKLAEQVESEYQYGWSFIKPKWDEWAVRLKLYNNQKRDKEAIGDPLLFTIFQTVFASLYDDRLGVSFEAREAGDEEIAESLDSLAEFDYDEMEKDVIDYELDWDTCFFGRGLVSLFEYDRKDKVPVPEVWDPMTVIRDPKAKSVNGTTKRRKGAARFLYREVRMSKRELKDMGVYFNLDKIKADTNEIKSLLDRNQELRSEAQGLQPTTFMDSLEGENKTCHILEGFTMHKGKRVLVAWANNRQLLIRYQVMDSVHIPVIDRSLFPISHDWDGVSIPDLVEDKQRARAALQNMGLQAVKAGLNPMYIFNANKITNRQDLDFDFNKFIPVNGDPNNAVIPMQRDAVKSEVSWILDTLDTAAQRATATPDMQQGSLGSQRRTATELELVDQKVGTRYSLAARIFGWSEKRFWLEWYRMYKEHFVSGIDEKIIRINGALGTKWRPLTRENIIANTDPDVKVESRVVADAKRTEKFQLFRAWLAAIAGDPNTNLRSAFKQLGRLSGLKKDEIDMVYPPTPDELIAEEENLILNENERVDISPDDDHRIHIEVHNRAADTPAKYAHIRAHLKAIMLQRSQPELFNPMGEIPPSAMNPNPGQGLPPGQPEVTQQAAAQAGGVGIS